jgi:hypothetical protein
MWRKMGQQKSTVLRGQGEEEGQERKRGGGLMSIIPATWEAEIGRTVV